ncbi:MAG TPA: bifunctional methylenetetrahydrofolate dehydrogenase/methenyltetrahydrofolate cyclohydrolase, partial [candidate division WOR-3 bacterium]|nr:bifunctional methylenetetrahydrofolate dehydrogenase/methenyltetrahydrofolate cyclohydrolase [candidate division WOR-3 bacterium]
EIIKFYNIQTDGEFVVIIGRSEVVGKPIANLFLLKTQTGNATVTVCHSKTKNLKGISKKADILVVSIGKPNFIDSGFVKRGSFVIDVGINLTPEGIKGDVNFEDVSSYVKGITPVPGGVGSITSALLMKNLSYL